MTTKKITIPELALVVLIGASGSGKSTFARKHFRSTEILSSDYCRGLVSDDENDQSVSQDAFDILHYIAAKRLAAGRLTVIDATNVQAEDRKYYVQLARQYHCLPVAIILDLPEHLCLNRNQGRPERQVDSHIVQQQIYHLCQTLGGARSLKGLEKEGFRHCYLLSSVAEINQAMIERQPLWNNRKQEHGPFDIIGDIHGCCDELEELLHKLGYVSSGLEENTNPDFWSFPTYFHPEGRKAVFLGDLVDRGPRILDTLKLVHNMVEAKTALCLPGNHDIKLLRKLKGKKVTVNHGLEQTLQEIGSLPDEIADSAQQEIMTFLDGLVSHYVLDEGKLVVAHAGMKEELQGRESARVREFALYGEITGEIDEFGLPVRYNWAADYRGKAMVIYGHTPVSQPEWLNNTLNIDTGCVFGGQLTSLRYPEKDMLSVTAKRVYCETLRKRIQFGSRDSQF
jgi:protein phosphatase